MLSRLAPLALPSLALAAIGLLAPAHLAAQDPEAVPAPPPDRIVLTNGDTLTGTIKSMADGVITLTSPALGDLEIKLADVQDLTTGGPITLETKAGDRFDRQVTGRSGDALELTGGAAGEPAIDEIQLDALGRINPPAKEEPQWTGSFNLGASLSAGNTDRRAVTASAEALRRTEVDRTTAKFNWIYADEKTTPGSRTLSERRTAGSLKYDYFLTDDLYTFAKVGALGDALANIDLRFDAGGGLGYQWIEEDHLNLFTEAGLSYFSEAYRTSIPATESVVARLAYGLTWMIDEGWTFLQDVEVLPSVESSDDIFLTADSRLRVSLTEAMFMQGQWLLNYDNTPSPGLERVDHRFLVTVGWSF